MPSTVPAPGQLVTVRRRRFVVTDVAASASVAHPAGLRGPQHRISLSSIDDDAGDELQVIWELEPGTEVLDRAELPQVEGFDEPRRLDAFLDAVRWGAVSSADVGALHAPFRSGITIEDYQLDPVARALQMPRVNLLVADDVGLGKTIEAGLVVQELLLRHRARTVLVVCPAGLQLQWRDQMRDKFGLDFRIIDTEALQELRRTRGIHVNPWTHFPRLITSIDFLKRDRPLRLFRETLPAAGEPIFPRRFDLLIVDEAHNVAPSGSGKFAKDSQRTKAIQALAPHFEHKLFLSATPHNGYPESFQSLLELLDDQRFHRGVSPDRKQLEAVMVRRLKSELLDWAGERRFATRELEPLEVDYDEAEREAHRNLEAYRKAVLASAGADGFAAEFVLKLLKKRLFSSPAAFAITLEKHAASMRRARDGAATKTVLARQLELVEEDYADDNAYEEAETEAVETAGRALQLDARAKELLERLQKFADRLKGRADAKAERLLSFLEETLRPDGEWNDERVIIFTEYRATQNWLQSLLTAKGLAQDGRLQLLYGGMDKKDREAVKAAFQAKPSESPVRILLATDAASEGIDLQNHCHRLVHFEIPWNPNRLEQRNGRVDRHGQRANKVRIFHFVGRGWDAAKPGRAPGELEGDLEFLARVAHKVEAIREDLGKVGPVIANQISEAMLGRRAHLDTRKAEEDAGGVRKMLKFERQLREQIRRLHDKLIESRTVLHLTPGHVQAVVEVGLALAGQPALVPGRLEDDTPVFRLPNLSGVWAPCSTGLEHPHTKVRRPITFDADLAAGRDDVVLVHLNHRLVQLCLGLLRAEIWSQGNRKLHRVTARAIPSGLVDAPVVVAHGRLVVLGADNTRLHEELVFAGGTLKEGRLSKLGLKELERLVAAGTDRSPPEPFLEKLQKSWPIHRDALFKALEARSEDRGLSLGKLLAERAEKEVTDLQSVLVELKKQIEAAFEEKPQLDLFAPDEQVQIELNRDSLRARAESIPAEIERETEAIRKKYAAPTRRLFPVSVTYLVPEHLTR